MEKIGVLVVSYGAREVAMVDAFVRSQEYKVEVYVADKQRNPFNLKNAAKHVVIPDLNVAEICKFAKHNRGKLDFGIIGPEKPIIEGIRNIIEEETHLPIICPTKEYAIESSKVQQRLLFQQIVPEVNPLFKIFHPKDYESRVDLKKAVYTWLDELGNQAVVKPDQPAAGKGVGVWGDHFKTREQLFEHFMENFQYGSVLIEEKIDGEESSFQALCDGKHLMLLPETRDYKRAFDNDEGPNTGGMGSYKDVGDVLPFMRQTDREKEENIVTRIFKKWSAKDNTALRGVPFYMAFMHSKSGPKILENNSRPGDPEIMNILPLLKDDFIDICYRILEGNLTHIALEKAATVVTYKVPPNYGGYTDLFSRPVDEDEIGKPVDLNEAYALIKKHGDSLRVYPAAMELRNSKTYALKSRAVAVIGKGEDIETARQISLKGVDAVKGGALWYRRDIASRQHIEKSIKHMEELRRRR